MCSSDLAAELVVKVVDNAVAALLRYRDAALTLSGGRHQAAKALGEDITRRMQGIGMAGGHFAIAVQSVPDGDPQPTGIDAIEFRVSANPGQPPRSLGKVASGGELARLSLAVQVACTADERRCMVFDEVDAGVGGQTAQQIGSCLSELGSRQQVLAITHLASVAARADHHFVVEKSVVGITTQTVIRRVSGEERVREIARMLSGESYSAEALALARRLLTGE